MQPTHPASLESLIEMFTEVIAAKVSAHLAAEGAEGGKIRPRLLTVEEAAQYLGRSKEAVQHMIASGKLPTVRSDRRVFLDRHDLDRWIEDCKVQ